MAKLFSLWRCVCWSYPTPQHTSEFSILRHKNAKRRASTQKRLLSRQTQRFLRSLSSGGIRRGWRSQSREVRRHDWKNNNIRFSGRTPFPFSVCGERVIYRVRDVWKRCIGLADCCFFLCRRARARSRERGALNGGRWMEIWRRAFVAVINLLTALIYCARRRTRAAKVKNASPESRRAPLATLCMTPHEIDFCTQRNMGGTADQCFYYGFVIKFTTAGLF